MKNQKAVDYRHLKGFTALFVALFLVLTASCVSRKECLVCNSVMDGYNFLRFDSIYVPRKDLWNVWLLDSIRSAAAMPLSDSLIILSSTQAFSPCPLITVKSGQDFIKIDYRRTPIPSYYPIVKYYDTYPDALYNEELRLKELTVFSWNIDRLKSVLLCSPAFISDSPYYTMVRVVQKNGRIRDWEEYRFSEPHTWTDCSDSLYWKQLWED